MRRLLCAAALLAAAVLECQAGGGAEYPRNLGPDPNWQMLLREARSLEGLTVGPEDQNRRQLLIHALFMLGQRKEALTESFLFIRLYPNSPLALCAGVNAVRTFGAEHDAMRLLQAGMKRFAREPSVANLVAWMLATSPFPAYRDARRAVKVAQAVCETDGWNDVSYIDTLAAAEAAVGNFPRAVQLQQRVLEKGFGPKSPPYIVAQAHERLAAFRKGEAWIFRRPAGMP